MYRVQNKIEVGLNINGQDINFLDVPFGFITLRNHWDYQLPTCTFTLFDVVDVFRQNPLSEGSIVQVYMSHIGSSVSQWMPFRIFSHTESNHQGQTVYRVSCYYDAVEYWKTRQIESFEDTSSNIIEQIASRAGLNVDADVSLDRGIWINSNQTWSQFLNNIILPSTYSDAESYFRSVISSNFGGIKLKDMTRLMYEQSAAFVTNAAKDFGNAIVEYKAHDLSGWRNTEGGYGLNSTYYDSVRGQIGTTSGLDVRKNTERLNLNRQLIEREGKSSFHDKRPLNMGNKTREVEEAEARNLRQTAIWSSAMDLLMRSFTNLDVFAPLDVEIVKGLSGKVLNLQASGRWVVAGKCQAASMTEYVEKLVLFRSGTDSPSEELEG